MYVLIEKQDFGRYDIELEPKDITQNAFIMEFKLYAENDTIEDVIEHAKNQIEEKKYEANLRERGIENITKIAFAFRGKKCELKVFE